MAAQPKKRKNKEKFIVLDFCEDKKSNQKRIKKKNFQAFDL